MKLCPPSCGCSSRSPSVSATDGAAHGSGVRRSNPPRRRADRRHEDNAPAKHCAIRTAPGRMVQRPLRRPPPMPSILSPRLALLAALPMLLLMLAGCATTTASVGTDAVACSAFEPIRWSSKDADEPSLRRRDRAPFRAADRTSDRRSRKARARRSPCRQRPARSMPRSVRREIPRSSARGLSRPPSSSSSHRSLDRLMCDGMSTPPFDFAPTIYSLRIRSWPKVRARPLQLAIAIDRIAVGHVGFEAEPEVFGSVALICSAARRAAGRSGFIARASRRSRLIASRRSRSIYSVLLIWPPTWEVD